MTKISPYTLEDAKLDLHGVQLIQNSASDSDRVREEIEFIFSKLSGDAKMIECPICDGAGNMNTWPDEPCHACNGNTKVYEREWRGNELP